MIGSAVSSRYTGNRSHTHSMRAAFQVGRITPVHAWNLSSSSLKSSDSHYDLLIQKDLQLRENLDAPPVFIVAEGDSSIAMKHLLTVAVT